MKITIRKQIGDANFSFEVDEKKEKDTLFKAGMLASTPTACGLCNSQNVRLASNRAQDFTFVNVICLDCRARSQMGEYKDGSGFWWKKWEKYAGKTETQNQPSKEYPFEEGEEIIDDEEEFSQD